MPSHYCSTRIARAIHSQLAAQDCLPKPKTVKPEAIRVAVLRVLYFGRRYAQRYTAAEIAAQIGHPYATATVTAKLRELRKPRFGGHVIECGRCPEEERGDGYIYRYLLVS